MILISIISCILIAIFFIPIKVDVKLSTYRLNEKNNKFNDRIKIKILYFFTIFTYRISNKNNKNNKKTNNIEEIVDKIINLTNKYKKKIIKKSEIIKVLKQIKVSQFILSLGVNTGDYILNSYINTFLNIALCMVINLNSKNFDFKNLYYKIYTSEKLCEYDISCIFSFKIVNTIVMFLKVIYRSLKERWNLKCQNNIQLKI